MLHFIRVVVAIFICINLLYTRFLYERYPDHPDSIWFQKAHTRAALFALIILWVI